MPAKKSATAAELARTQEQLAAAQSRIAELEGFLANTRSLPLDQLPLDFYRHTLDNLLESCQIIGFDWRYLYLNDAAVSAGRMSREEMLGYTVMEKYPGIESTEMFAAMRKCMEERTSQDAEFDFTFADQSKESFDFKIQPVPEGIFILAINITERKLADEQVRKLNRTLAVLSDINQSIVRIRDIPKLLQRVCTIAVEKGTFRMAWIGLLNPQTRQIMPMGHAGMSDSYVKNLNITIDQGEYGTGPSAIVLRSGQRVIIDDVEDSPIMQPWREDARRLGFRSSAALPLIVGGEVRGVFHLYASEPDFFDPPEIRLLDEMVDDIAFAMEFAEQEAQRKQADEAQRRYAQRLEVLHQIDQELVQGRSVEELIRGTMKHLRQIIPCQQANVILIDHAANEGLIYAVDYSKESAYSEGVRYPLPPDAFEGYDARHLRIFDDIRLEPETNARAKRLASEGLISGLSAFLMDHDTPIASLSLLSNKPNFFTPEYQDIAVEIATQLAIAIKQMRLSESLEQRVTERTAEVSDAKRRVEAILNNSADGILLMHTDLSIQQTNLSFNSLFACDQDDYFSKSLLTLAQAEDQDKLRKFIQTVASGQQKNSIEILSLRKDGTAFDAELSIGYIKDNGLVCTIHDITERKKQERQLQYHASLQENVSDAVIVTDLELHIQSWNRAAERIYGWSAQEVVGKAEVEILHTQFSSPNDSERTARQLREQGWWHGEVIQRHKDGTTRHILGSVSLVKDENGTPFEIVSVNHDVTEAKEAEETLRESEVRYRLLAENIHDVVMRLTPTFNYLYVSPSSRTVLGYEPEELLGVSDFRRIHPDDATAIREVIKKLMEHPGRASIIYRFLHKQGHYIWLESAGQAVLSEQTGEVVEFVFSARDITERKQLLTELEQQRTFLREVIDVSPNMIFVKDYNARFVLVNPMVARMYSTTVEDLIGKSDADFNASPEEVAHFLEADRKVIATGETLIIEEPVTNTDGETRWFQTIKVPIVSADGKSKYVLGLSTDITERRNSEKRLQEAFQKEKELGELKSRFVSMASHEFRTPLATILAVTETLSAYRNKMEDSQIDQRLNKIQDQVGHLKDVIDDVLQLAQIQAKKVVFNPVLVDLDAMCRSVLDEFQSRPNIKHELVYTCDAKLREAYLDKRLMRQIISNLMSNAVKYSPEGKTIRINLEEKDNNLIFKIQDQGIGIPEADLKHLFEPFHRADNVGTISGTGLGLVITKESVELHGGTITVESTVGEGTTFTVTIPLAQ
jgi:PAS domain S-box-containing protein